MKNKNIAVFISGTGTNFRNIVSYFSVSNHNSKGCFVRVALLVSSNSKSPAIPFALQNNIPVNIITKDDLYYSQKVLHLLESHSIDFMVLAGFLWLIPKNLIQAFPFNIVNIHPALLPKYGGKGMYGDRVHQAVKSNGDNETGITIHYVNEQYDQGDVIAQYSCSVEKQDSVSHIAEKVHDLEYKYFPKIIESVVCL